MIDTSGVNAMVPERSRRLMRLAALACVLALGVLPQVPGQQFASGQSAAMATESAEALPTIDQDALMNPIAVDQRDLQLSLALSTPEYPVTPGDIYLLSFLPAAAALGGAVTRISTPVVVGSDYAIDLGVFGALDGRDLRFNDLRRRVVALVRDAYPGSNPALFLTDVGVFEVHVRGAVETAGFVPTWGLGRLTEVLEGRLTAHASIRDVRIERDGAILVYDLFRAQRFGVRSQDPYLAPGDRACVSRLARAVTIAGEVWRPGTYQLLTGEDLGDLVAYAGGFTPQADLDRMRIDSLGAASAPRAPADRSAGAGNGPSGARLDCDGRPFAAWSAYHEGEHGATRYAAWDARLARAPLRNGDVVTVTDRDALLPAVFFEVPMIVNSSVGEDVMNGSVGEETWLRYPYRPGQTLFSALQEILESIADNADLASATFARPGAPEEPIDLESLLHGGSRAGDRALEPMDRIIIPALRRSSVTVAGAVTRPGVVPYVPDRTAEYYIRVAGGRNRALSDGSGVSVTDAQGRLKERSSTVAPDDQVFVPADSFAYHFDRIIRPVATLGGLVISIISLVVSVSS